MPANSLADAIRAAGVACEPADEVLGSVVRLDAARIALALEAARGAGWDVLVDLFATDTGERVEVTYHLRALATLTDAFVKVLVEYDGELPSVWRVYPASLYAEREAAELLGISFPGHPNPKRLLTTDGVEPLLRKSVLIRSAEEVRLP